MIHIEFAHITPNLKPKEIIDSVNQSLGLIDYFASKDTISLGILVDDLYDTTLNANTVSAWIDQLEIKPDNIYSEKSFGKIAEKLLEKISNDKASFRENSKCLWLQVQSKRYSSDVEFILCRYLDSRTEYSCPILAAATYLWRLGYFEDEKIFFYGGKYVPEVTHIVNFLDPYFIEVESQVRRIIELSYPEALDKITWIFHKK